MQKSLVIIKPDAFQRDLIGEVIGRFERKGLKIVAMKMGVLDDTTLDVHYEHHKDKPFFKDLKQYMMSTPVVFMVLEGIDVVGSVRQIVGATNPRNADAGSIRGDLAMNIPSNLVHASDSPESAQAEIKRFFSDKEIYQYEKITDKYHFGEGV
ncbi:TPA: nucleoside-diphosphate kinase [Candidatus Uhrbacteria bacterium]|nr:nucleoside-diphosphate kinase [Candidatus Uhrbacteria bacterium]